MQTQATSAGERLSIRSLLQQSWRSVRREGIAVVALAFFANVVLIVIARPLIGLLFRRALQLSGEHGLDFTQLHLSAGSILALVLVLVIGLVAFALVAIQLILLLLALQQVASAGRVRLRMLFIALKQVSRRLFRVSSIPLFVYLFALLPISGLGFLSSLTQVIAVPNFVSGELLKSPLTAALWSLLLLAVLVMNIRFALTLPIFVRSEVTGSRAMRLSWRMVRGRAF